MKNSMVISIQGWVEQLLMEEATRKVERRFAVETVRTVLNVRVVYRVEMTESFRL